MNIDSKTFLILMALSVNWEKLSVLNSHTVDDDDDDVACGFMMAVDERKVLNKNRRGRKTKWIKMKTRLTINVNQNEIFLLFLLLSLILIILAVSFLGWMEMLQISYYLFFSVSSFSERWEEMMMMTDSKIGCEFFDLNPSASYSLCSFHYSIHR